MAEETKTEKKRQRENTNLPNCVKGNAPPENFKRRMIEKFSISSNVEEDERRIEQRMKQIKFGKNTIGYDRYIAAVPKDKRRGYAEHPRTPDPYEKIPKRAFDGRIKAWRRQLHQWDVDNNAEKATEATVSNVISTEDSKEEEVIIAKPNVDFVEQEENYEENDEDDVL